MRRRQHRRCLRRAARLGRGLGLLGRVARRRRRRGGRRAGLRPRGQALRQLWHVRRQRRGELAGRERRRELERQREAAAALSRRPAGRARWPLHRRGRLRRPHRRADDRTPHPGRFTLRLAERPKRRQRDFLLGRRDARRVQRVCHRGPTPRRRLRYQRRRGHFAQRRHPRRFSAVVRHARRLCRGEDGVRVDVRLPRRDVRRRRRPRRRRRLLRRHGAVYL
mmetsp:Transcript_7375/g.26313  ORF Transcript_7375/g.26313 Transcript_7375/m.26313 type:complete len:222 (+) Transcript_7375:1289-1954(+)